MTTAASIPAGKVATIDPATGIELAAYAETSDDQVEAILERAYRAGAAWREVPVTERAETVRRLGRALRERGGELARLATAEMGKPLAQSQAEVEKCAAACEWFAEHGPGLLAPETVATEARLSQVRYEPLGVLFAIMPWNFPYWQVIRALAPRRFRCSTPRPSSCVLNHRAAGSICASEKFGPTANCSIFSSGAT
jgi:succinate-semialdehyde dehydrogenase/glutarate-semialdehyde dehydrogenase